jgi:hypothetical protein
MRLWVCVALFTKVAMGGTYGGVSRSFTGYSAGIDCSVGSMSDHSAEGRMFEECKQRAEAELTRRAADVAAIYKHFAEGKHRWKRNLALLDRARKEADWDHSVRVELSLPQPDDVIVTTRPIAIGLYVKQPPDQATREKLSLAFAASQLEGDGALAKMKPRPQKDPADTQQLLLGMAGMLHSNPVAFMRLCAERRDEIAQLARLNDPLPKKYDWQTDQRPALEIARILDAFLRAQPLPKAGDPELAKMIELLTP